MAKATPGKLADETRPADDRPDVDRSSPWRPKFDKSSLLSLSKGRLERLRDDFRQVAKELPDAASRMIETVSGYAHGTCGSLNDFPLPDRYRGVRDLPALSMTVGDGGLLCSEWPEERRYGAFDGTVRVRTDVTLACNYRTPRRSDDRPTRVLKTGDGVLMRFVGERLPPAPIGDARRIVGDAQRCLGLTPDPHFEVGDSGSVSESDWMQFLHGWGITAGHRCGYRVARFVPGGCEPNRGWSGTFRSKTYLSKMTLPTTIPGLAVPGLRMPAFVVSEIERIYEASALAIEAVLNGAIAARDFRSPWTDDPKATVLEMENLAVPGIERENAMAEFVRRNGVAAARFEKMLAGILEAFYEPADRTEANGFATPATDPSDASATLAVLATPTPRALNRRRRKSGTGRPAQYDESFVAALTSHHRYGNGRCEVFEPISTSAMRDAAGNCSDRAVSDFWKRIFPRVKGKPRKRYEIACSRRGPLVALLMRLNKEELSAEALGIDFDKLLRDDD